MTEWWNSLDTFERQMTIGLAIAAVVLLIVVALAVVNFRVKPDPRPMVQEQEVCGHPVRFVLPIFGTNQHGRMCFDCGLLDQPDEAPAGDPISEERRHRDAVLAHWEQELGLTQPGEFSPDEYQHFNPDPARPYVLSREQIEQIERDAAAHRPDLFHGDPSIQTKYDGSR